MKCPNIERTIGQKEIRAKDKVQNGRVSNLQVQIHQPRREALETKEEVYPMQYQLAQIIRRNIGASVAWEAMHVICVAKQDTKLKTIQERIDHKGLERRC